MVGSVLKLSLVLLGALYVAWALPHKHGKHQRTCDRCLPGWGLVSLCNETHTSVCKPCPPRTWSPHRPHLQGCRACSRCGWGLYVVQQCMSTRDTTCGWCSGTNGHFNIDFIKKCLMRNDVPKSEESAALRLFFEEEKKNQMVAGHRVFDANPHHRLWQPESGEKLEQNTIILKPSYHGYDIQRIAHAHRRKVFILVSLTGIILVATVAFAGCFLYQYCCADNEQKPSYRISNQKLYVQLTEEQQSMIRQSAEYLENAGKERLSLNEDGLLPYTVGSQDEYWEENPLNITENPLEKLLPSFDAQVEGYCSEQVHEKVAESSVEK